MALALVGHWLSCLKSSIVAKTHRADLQIQANLQLNNDINIETTDILNKLFTAIVVFW